MFKVVETTGASHDSDLEVFYHDIADAGAYAESLDITCPECDFGVVSVVRFGVAATAQDGHRMVDVSSYETLGKAFMASYETRDEAAQALSVAESSESTDGVTYVVREY